eukprot:8089076-Pyramimonas_sp.AAC.1
MLTNFGRSAPQARRGHEQSCACRALVRQPGAVVGGREAASGAGRRRPGAGGRGQTANKQRCATSPQERLRQLCVVARAYGPSRRGVEAPHNPRA